MWTFAGRTFQARIVVCAKVLMATYPACLRLQLDEQEGKLFRDEDAAEQKQENACSLHIALESPLKPNRAWNTYSRKENFMCTESPNNMVRIQLCLNINSVVCLLPPLRIQSQNSEVHLRK